MALDYSKLSTDELEAIANDDFRKLSNRTLRALSNEPEPTALDKFKEPFKDVSVKDWAEKSFLAPMLQTMQSVTPFGMLRPDLARQNLQQGSQNLAGKVGQMAQGAYNVATNPVESAQKAYTAVTENPAGVAGEMAKGLLYDPEMLIGSGLGNVAEKGLMSAGRGVKNVAGGASDIVGGAIGRGTGYIAKPGEAPVGYQVPSSRAPLRNTVMLPEDMAKFERGEMPYGQLPTEVPIQQLPRNAVERTALKLSGGEIPYQGQAARAFGERLGETYRNPFTAALDIGSIFATGGIPVLTAARSGLAGVQGIADSILARRGLDPNLPTRLADYQSGSRPMPGTPPPRAPAPGPVNPATMNYPLTVQGPGQQLPPSVIPMGGPPRQVNIEGQSYKLPYQIDTAQSQTARPQPVQQTPQQMAVQKTQEIVNQQAPTRTPQQQAILDQIRARKNPPPAPEGGIPVVNNNPPPPPAGGGTGSMFESLPGQRWTPAEKLALERANLQNNSPPAMTAAQEAEMAKQSNLTDWGKKTTADKDGAKGVLQDWFDNGGTIGKGATDPIYGKMIDLDDKVALKEVSTRLANQAKEIQKKAGVDEIPSIPGFRDEEVIRMAYDMLTTKKSPAYTPSQSTSLQEALNKAKGSNEARTSKTINNELNSIDEQMTNLRDDALENGLKPNTPEGQAYSNQLGELTNQVKALEKELELAKKAEKKASKSPPKNVSQMMVGEPKATGPLEQSLVSKRSFNGDLQKYRYGTEKSPLTLQEYNHLKNSEFIDKQNTRDILMGMRPELTEYSIWYKDKSGKIQNIQTYGNEFKKK